MRGSQFVQFSIIAIALLGTVASGVSAAESGCLCFDSAFRVGGGIYDFPVLSADLTFEGAIGLPEFSLAIWADVQTLPVIAPTFGGEAKLTRDWLSLSMTAQQSEPQMELTLQGRANPPAWLLYDGIPMLFGGITAIARTGLLKGSAGSELVLSPLLTGIILAGETSVSPSIGFDVSLDSENQVLAVSGSRLTSTVNAGIVLIANTVNFSGLFDAFSSLVVSISMQNCGLIVSGSLIPTGVGGFSYRASVSYEWGDTYLLPVQAEGPGSSCIGGVCY